MPINFPSESGFFSLIVIYKERRKSSIVNDKDGASYELWKSGLTSIETIAIIKLELSKGDENEIKKKSLTAIKIRKINIVVQEIED